MTDAPRSPSEEEVRQAAAVVIASEGFSRSPRLRAFFSYVLEETIAGRGQAIRAKTIAQDVYGRDPSHKAYSENVVRVDARRLRRLLDDYYAHDGAGAALRITIPVGRYAPLFTSLERPGRSAEAPASMRRAARLSAPTIGAVLAGLAAIVGFALYLPNHAASLSASGGTISEAERLALFDRSGASLQAENLCRQGRNLLFPIADMSQQTSATDLFRRAIDLDPGYGCGYAGAAHSLTTQAMLISDDALKKTLLSEAQEMAIRAQAIDPTDGWAVSGLAWVALAQRDLDRAYELSSRSAEISPADGNVLDFHGVISILTGRYEAARRATDPARHRDTMGLEHARSNIYGVASYHAGRYPEAIAAFESAIRRGEPVSALTFIYLAVSHAAAGDSAAAASYVRGLAEGYPDFPVRMVLERLYPQRAASDRILDHLEAAGWVDPPVPSQRINDG